MKYFDHYWVDDPMDELSEAEARGRPSHAELVDVPVRHFRVFLDRELQHVVYPDSAPGESVTKLHATQYGNAPLWIVSPVVRDDAGKHYDIWYYDGPSVPPARTHYDVGERTVETIYDQTGQLTVTRERRYNDARDQIEVIERDASGRVILIDD